MINGFLQVTLLLIVYLFMAFCVLAVAILVAISPFLILGYLANHKKWKR